MTRFDLDRWSHTRNILVLLLVGYFFLMFGNGLVSWTHPDEVFYTQTAKEMIAHDSWFVPYIFDEPQFEKPFLFYALLAAAIKIFGLTPFVSRFWPAFFGMLGVCLTYWISWMMFRKKQAALLSGFILSSTMIYIGLSRAILTDMVFSIMIVASLGFFLWGMKDNKKATLAIVSGWLVAGLAVLTKGILGFLFTFTILVIYSLFKREAKFIKHWGHAIGALLFLLVVLPWHLKMYLQFGDGFLYEYFQNVHVRRLFDAEHMRLDNWYFYPGLMFAGMMPWTFLFIASILSVKSFIKKNKAVVGAFAFLASWVLGVFILMQPAHSKLASYIFPIYPAQAIWLGFFLTQSREQKINTKIISCVTWLFICLISVGIIVGLIFAHKYADFLINLKPIYGFAVWLALVVVAMIYFWLKRQLFKVMFAMSAIPLSLVFTLNFVKPYVEPWVSCQLVSEMLEEIDPESDTVVLASKFYVRGVRFYTDRSMAVIDINGKGFFSPHPIPFLNTDEGVRDLLKSQSETFAVVKRIDVINLERISKRYLYKMEKLGGVGGKFIVKLTPLNQESL